jgi:hypothetical protein
MIRGILLIGFAAGGVYGAFRLLETLAEKAGGGEFHLSMEAVPLLIPVGMVGALMGAFLGGMLLPKPKDR